MLTKPRRQKYFKIKFAVYIFLLGILAISFFFLKAFFVSKKPLFISPIVKTNADKTIVEKLLKDKKILFSKVVMSDYSYLIEIQNNGQVKLSQNKDIGQQIASLQRILIQLTIEGKPFKSIDFRFSEPIIVF